MAEPTKREVMTDAVELEGSQRTSEEHVPFVDEQKLIRKIDFKVLPILFLIYVAAFLDRVNISNALTMNLPTDLGLTGSQPNVALCIFFVPYVLFEIPSNILLKHFKPHLWLSGCILTFGILMLSQGFVQSYGGLLTTRFLLGLAEAGIFPGSFYILSFWYRRHDAQKRFTFYWCSVLVATAFGGLLASAIAGMNGIGGLSNWRWIFILEGIATILVGFLAYFTVSDFPEDARWLSDDERKWVVAATGRSKNAASKASVEEEHVTLTDVLTFFKSFKNVIGGVIYFTYLVPIYGFAYFAPTIIKGLGYSTVQTQLHTVPPVAAALGLAIILAYASDRFQIRMPFVFGCQIVTLIGIVLLYTIHNNFSAEYLGICFIAMGAFAGGPIWVCWYTLNHKGHVQRSIGTAFMISFGNTGGIVATFAFLTTEAPYYSQGYSALLAVTCVGLVAVLLYTWRVTVENKAIKAGQKDKDLNSL